MKSTDFYIKKDNRIIIESNNTLVLYKYQSISNYSISNLENDEIWGTIPTMFNDPYDSAVCYNLPNIIKNINQNLNNIRLELYKKNLELKNKQEVIDYLKENLLENYNENQRKQICVSCFSIYNDSEIMWGHYANNAKGFVIEYNGFDLYKCAMMANEIALDIFKEINPYNIDYSNIKKDYLCAITPIIYGNQKINITKDILKILPMLIEYIDNICYGKKFKDLVLEFISNIMQNYYENLEHENDLIYSIIGLKNKCWSYEQEWRIWSYNTNIYTGNFLSPYAKIGNVKPKAIYLGEKISNFDKTGIIDIAKRKNIPVFQMKTKMLKNNFKLVAIPIK